MLKYGISPKPIMVSTRKMVFMEKEFRAPLALPKGGKSGFMSVSLFN